MIKAVSSFDAKTAAGLLAKAALTVGYKSSDDIISQILDEVRLRLGLAAEANDPESLELIADLLDEESDKLIPQPNTESALFRLAQRGDLPSDLYEINIIPNVIDIYGKHFALASKLLFVRQRLSSTMDSTIGLMNQQ
jgi:hypothetical protein